MVNFIIWLIAGGVIGGLVTIFMPRRSNLLLNIVMGSIAACVAGFWLAPLLDISTIGFSMPGLLVTLGSTIVLLPAVNIFVKEDTLTNAVIEHQMGLMQRRIRARWGKTIGEDDGWINGHNNRYGAWIEEGYGIAQEKAEDQLQRSLRAVITKGS